MITAVIDAGQHYCQAVSDLWQWDYGQTLRIQGVKIPAAVEVQFSTTERIGETVTRIGVTQEGVTEVPIPDTLLEGGGTTQDYTIYAFVYIENGDSGKTEYRVSMKVRARPKPEAHATPEEGELFRQAIVAVAESADRAESARESAETASDQAEDAKNAAEEAADEAKTSKENAETAAKVAEAFKTETETARSEAVRAATESTDAKDSAEKSRAAAEKAKQDAEAAKAAADADKEAAEAAQAKAEAAQKAAENAETEAKKAQTATETAKNDAVQAKEAAEKAKSGTAADREVTEAASKAAQVSAVSAEKSAERAGTAKEEIQESADQIQKNATEIDLLKEDKITKPAEAPTIGKIIRVKSVNEDGTFVCEWADSGGSNLDVRIDGESIVQDGVAEMPVAGYTSPTQIRRTGLVCVPQGYGISFQYNTHNLIISNPSTDLIDNRNKMWQVDYYALTLRRIDYAVKAAMCDGKGTAWTAEEQAAARERIGIDEWELACDVTLEKDSNNVIIQLNGDYSEVYGILKFPVVPSGEHRMMFYDTNNGSWNNAQGAFCQDVRCNERTFIHAGIYDGIAIFDYHGQTQALAPYPSPVSRSMKECKDTRINAFATFAFTSPSGTNFKIWGRKI